jgi:hypothetical protein
MASKYERRGFLKLAGAAAALGLPVVWTPNNRLQRTRAATPLNRSVGRLDPDSVVH